MQPLEFIIFYVSRVLMFYSSRFLEPSWWRFKSDWLKTQVLEWPARSHSSSFFQCRLPKTSIQRSRKQHQLAYIYIYIYIYIESGSPEIKEKGTIIMKFINVHCNWGPFLDSVAERMRKSTKLNEYHWFSMIFLELYNYLRPFSLIALQKEQENQGKVKKMIDFRFHLFDFL